MYLSSDYNKSLHFPQRYRDPIPLNTKCVREVLRLRRDRYGAELPNNKLGREFAFVLATHRCQKPHTAKTIIRLIGEWCPWMPEAERRALYVAAVVPRRWKAETLGRKLQVTPDERERLGLTQMRAVGDPAPEELRKAKARRRMAKVRQRAGATPRAKSYAATKPWELEGKSRRTWFRHRKNGTDSCHVALIRSHPIKKDSCYTVRTKRCHGVVEPSTSAPAKSLANGKTLTKGTPPAQRSPAGERSQPKATRSHGHEMVLTVPIMHRAALIRAGFVVDQTTLPRPPWWLANTNCEVRHV